MIPRCRLALTLLLSLSLLSPRMAWSASPAQDCALCGHACCCPEVCDLELENLKNQNRCSQKWQSCQLTAPTESQGLRETALKSRLTHAPGLPLNEQVRLEKAGDFLERPFLGLPSSLFPEVPTPPPRSTPA